MVPNETGFICKLADTVGFMQFLRRLIDEPGLAGRMGAAGRERIRTSFSIDQMVNGYADVYRQVTGHH